MSQGISFSQSWWLHFKKRREERSALRSRKMLICTSFGFKSTNLQYTFILYIIINMLFLTKRKSSSMYLPHQFCHNCCLFSIFGLSGYIPGVWDQSQWYWPEVQCLEPAMQGDHQHLLGSARGYPVKHPAVFSEPSGITGIELNLNVCFVIPI